MLQKLKALGRLLQIDRSNLTWLSVRCLKAVWEPICWLAGRRKYKIPDEPHRILFITLDNPGDALLTTPCLTALKRRFRGATLTVLAGEWSRELLEVHPAVSRVMTYNAPWFAGHVAHLRHQPFRPIRDLLRCLLDLWRGRFDLTVETRGEASHILLAYLTGASQRVGYAIWSQIPWLKAEAVGHLLTHRVPYPWDQWLQWHRVDYNLRVPASIGAIPDDPSLVLPVPPPARRSIEQLLDRGGVRTDDLLIGVQPGASRQRKRWPLGHFAKVLDALVERWGSRVVVMGSPQEEGLGQELARLMVHPPILAVGQTTFLEAAALVQRCRLVICNDSVVTHLASAVKTPVVTLSRSPSNFYAPYHTPGISVTRLLPCMNRGNPDGCDCPFLELRCLQEVTPEEVLAQAERLLKE